MPKVSVIIPTYNSVKYINDAIKSTLAQTYKPIEIIVVDDGSTDNTKEVVTPYMDRVKYLYKNNGGPASARNLGINNSSGEYIAFLDADDIWLPEKIELQMKRMLSDSNIGLISCGVIQVNESGHILGQYIEKNRKNRHETLKDLLTYNFVSGGSGALIRKRYIDTHGLFDETLFGTEDWDMWIRIAKRYKIDMLDKPLIKSRSSSGSVSSVNNTAKMLKNDLLVLKKAFSDVEYKNRFFLKMKAYGYRYFRAASTFYNSADKRQARKYVLKSFFINPFYLLSNKEFIGLFIRLVLGDKIFRLISGSNKHTKME